MHEHDLNFETSELMFMTVFSTSCCLKDLNTVEHTYDACPRYSQLGSFRTIAYLYTDSASTVRKKYSVFINSEAELHAIYAIYKQTRTLCVLQYFHNFPFLDTVALKDMWHRERWFLEYISQILFSLYTSSSVYWMKSNRRNYG